MEIARLTFRPVRSGELYWGDYVAKAADGGYVALCDGLADYYEINKRQRFDVVVSNTKPRHRQFNELVRRYGRLCIDHGPRPPAPRYARLFFSSFHHWLTLQYKAGARYIWLEIDA